MRTSGLSTRTWQHWLAAIGGLLAFSLAPAPALAEACGDLDDIADDLLDEYFDALGDLFTLSNETCTTITFAFAKACNTAVKDAVKCLNRQIGSLTKSTKPACKEAFADPEPCNTEYKIRAEEAKYFVGIYAEAAANDCITAANEFYNTCQFGF